MPVKIVKAAKYLGVQISQDGSAQKHLTDRAGKSRAAVKALQKFRAHRPLSKRWKLKVCRMAVVPV